jgi:hypothetical protein
MFIKKVSNTKFFIFTFICINFIFSQNCNLSNCFRDQGICISKTECKCINNFITFPIQKNNQKNQIFCNYERTSRWFPFLLELLLPSIGHIYLGKIKLGLFKLFLMIGPLIYLCIGHHFIDSVIGKWKYNILLFVNSIGIQIILQLSGLLICSIVTEVIKYCQNLKI